MKSNKINYLVVGGFILAMLAGLVVSLALLTGRTGATDTYYVMYRNVTGVKFGTQVLYEGFPIGQVEEITPTIEDGRLRFKVEISVSEGWRVAGDSVAEIAAPGLLSAVTVNIAGGSSMSFLSPGATLEGKEAANIFAAVSSVAGDLKNLTDTSIKPFLKDMNRAVNVFTRILEEDAQTAVKQIAALVDDLAKRAPGILSGMERLTQNLEEGSREMALMMTPENRKRIEAIVANFSETSEQMRLLLTAETRENLQAVAANLNAGSDQLRQLLTPENRAKLVSFIANMDDTASTIARMTRQLEGTRKDFSRLIASLNDLVDKNRPDVDRSVIALRQILDSVSRHIDSVNQNLEGASRNLYEFSRQIRQNPGLLLGSKPPTDRVSNQ